jgi:hypothetical protein
MASKSTSKASAASKAPSTKSQSSGSATAKSPARAPYQPSQEEVAALAYEIYQREGGSDVENWLRAERELIARGR